MRREVRAMAAVLPLVYADLGALLAPVIFATDAQGAENETQGDLGATFFSELNKNKNKEYIFFVVFNDIKCRTFFSQNPFLPQLQTVFSKSQYLQNTPSLDFF